MQISLEKITPFGIVSPLGFLPNKAPHYELLTKKQLKKNGIDRSFFCMA